MSTDTSHLFHGHPLRDRFFTYLANNPEVYKQFDRFTRRLIERGWKKASPWLVINRIRWEIDVETDGAESFKIPNGFIGLYSRYWEALNPQHAGFFTKRKLDCEVEWDTIY